MIFHEDCMRLSLCTNEQRGALLWALYEYSNEGKSPTTEDAVVYAMFDVMSKALDRARASWESRSSAGKLNTAKRNDRDTERQPNDSETPTNQLPTVYQQSTNELPITTESSTNLHDQHSSTDISGVSAEANINQQSTNGLPNAYQSTVTSNLDLGTSIKEQGTVGTKGGKPPTRTTFKIPTIEEIDAHCRERGNNIDAEYFWSYYNARGWELSKGNRMKDWKSAVVTWEKRDKERLASKPDNGTSGRRLSFDD
jgi:hypothetical protein